MSKNARSWCKESFESYLQDHVLFVKTVPDDMSSTTILKKWAHPFQEGISKRLQDKMSPKRGATQSVTLKRGNTGCSLPAYKMHLQKCQLQQNNALTQIKTFDGCMKYPHREKGRLKDGQGSNHSGSSYSCTQKFIAACKMFRSIQAGQSMLQRSASEMQFSSELKCKSTSDAV